MTLFKKKPKPPVSPKVIKFREAFKKFTVIKLEHRFDQGEFDGRIEMFLNGNDLEITSVVTLISNDILFMNFLADGEISEETLKKVKEMWIKDKE